MGGLTLRHGCAIAQVEYALRKSSVEPNVEVFEPKLFAGAVADEIVASIQEAISERGRCSLVLAGGKTPGSIYRALGLPPRVEDIDWAKLSLFWGDERWVPSDDSQSNYRMVCETLLGHVPKPGPSVYSVQFDGGTPEQAADKYGKVIAKALNAGEGNAGEGNAGEGNAGEGTLPVFDIVLLGIGEDGHTASIFPGSKAISAMDKVCLAVPHPGGGHRVTLTPGALFSARRIFFIVNGEQKATMLKRIFDKSGEVEQIPARLYEQARGEVTWFVDSEAARKLSHQA